MCGILIRIFAMDHPGFAGCEFQIVIAKDYRQDIIAIFSFQCT